VLLNRQEEWEKLKVRSTRRFGEDSVFGEGSLDARLILVGEAPGRQEAEQGRPFVGQAGKLLNELLVEAGIDRSAVYVTNVVKVRPTKENGGRVSNRPPRAGEVRDGLEVLREEISLLSPAALVLLGGVPAKALIKKSFAITKEHGEWFDSEPGVPALATYHPAYLLRQQGEGFDRLKEQAVEDLKTAWKRAR
jgi:uracil-DNA glycosylase family 4